MAGSYNHVVSTKTGKLLSNERALGMLDCYHGDVYETLEEMYGMIWYLADAAAHGDGHTSPSEWVELARVNYTEGLKLSPGVKRD